MTKNYLLKKLIQSSFAIGIFIAAPAYGQVTIGSGESPQKAAILEIKNKKADAVGGVTATKGGMILPRVELLNNKQLSPFFTASEQAEAGYETVEKPEHKGLFVYHVGNNEMAAGVYVWSGTEWEQVGTRPAVKPVIAGIQCGNASIDPSLFIPGEAYIGTMKIPYTGGNGGSYSAGSPIISTGNTGLTATLQTGILAYGNGELIYSVTGTPVSENPATFAIDFLGIPCSATVSGTVLGIGQTITFYGATSVTQTPGTLVSDLFPGELPVIDGIRLDIAWTGTGGPGSLGSARIYNEASIDKIVSISSEFGGGAVTTLLNQTIAPKLHKQLTASLPWGGASSSIITANVQVQINSTTYRWYELKAWGMEIGNQKIIFISAVRKA